jgi:CheY-like chemotaxis protein
MCTILVIDDEKGILSVIEAALRRFGHDVEIALDGIEGIKKFDDGCYDMVITDMRMPRLDGKGVVQHIRASRKNSIQAPPGRFRIRVSMPSFPNHFRFRIWWSRSKN